MKKILGSAIIMMALTTPFIEASMYIGVEQALSYKVKNTAEIGNYSESNSESPAISSIKIGGISGGKDKGNRYEFLYNFGDQSANPVGGLKGEDVISFNLHANITVPSISPIETILPYVRLGASYVISSDKYRVNGTTDKENYSAGGLLIGLGTYYQVTNNINLSAGFDYGYRLWQDLNYGYKTIESKDKISKLYMGVDYIF